MTIALVGDGSDTAEKIIGAMTIVVSVISAVAWVANKLAKKKKAKMRRSKANHGKRPNMGRG